MGIVTNGQDTKITWRQNQNEVSGRFDPPWMAIYLPRTHKTVVWPFCCLLSVIASHAQGSLWLAFLATAHLRPLEGLTFWTHTHASTLNTIHRFFGRNDNACPAYGARLMTTYFAEAVCAATANHMLDWCIWILCFCIVEDYMLISSFQADRAFKLVHSRRAQKEWTKNDTHIYKWKLRTK